MESISNGMVKCKNTAFIFSDGTGDELYNILFILEELVVSFQKE